MFKKTRKLQTQFFFAYLAIIFLFLAAFSLFFYIFLNRQLTSESMDNLYDTNMSIRSSVTANINDMDTVSININYSSIVRNTLAYDFNLEKSRDSYKALADLFVMINGTDSRVNYIYLYDMKGNCLQVDSVQKLIHVDIQEQPWYQPVIDNPGSHYISAPYQKKVGNYTTDSISLYRTYVDQNHRVIGIVETVKDCKSLFAPIIKFERSSKNHTRFYVYNKAGDLIYPYGKESEDPGYNKSRTSGEALSADSSEAKKIVNPLTGQTEYLTCLESSDIGWTYYAVQDEASVLEPLHSLTRTLLLFVALLLLLAAVLSHYLSRRLAHPISHLKHIIQRMQLSTLGTESPEDYPVFSSELRALYDSFDEMNQKLRLSRDQLIKVQEAELESRSLALQSQMSPHFYYNSLASISILAENGDTESVAGMCRNLSRIMRYVTDFKTRIVSIQEELDYIREYLYCMKTRNQSSLNYEIQVPDSLTGIQLPKLCIHPLVENALKYGTNCAPPWYVQIKGEQTEHYWKIRVSDNGPGFTEEALKKLDDNIKMIRSSGSQLPKLQINGLGLANIYIRLSIYFEDHFIFEYGNTPEGHAFIAVGGYFSDQKNDPEDSLPEPKST